MPIKVAMPRLDKDMVEGQISDWKVGDGDSVAKGDVLFEIETEKAAVEVEAEAAGTIHHIGYQEGDVAPVDAAVAWLYAEDEDVGDPPSDDAPALTSQRPAEPRAADKVQPAAEEPEKPAAARRDRQASTPAARKLAGDQGIALQGMTGTGPGGRVQMSDVLVATRDDVPAATPAMPPQQSGPLSVISSGKNERLPMVMIHGFLADASGWELLARPLAQHRRVHRIELPCHGRSPTRVPRDFPALAAELRQAFDALDAGPCHLVGHSLGGALALALADTRPRKVRSLTLIAPAGLGPDINSDMISGMCRASRSESLGPWMKLLTSDPDTIGWSFVQAAAALRRDPDLRAAQTGMADTLFPDGVQGFDLSAALQRTEMPSRIIWGRNDRVIPWKHALQAPGRVSLNLFENTGHLPHYERTESLLRLFENLA